MKTGGDDDDDGDGSDDEDEIFEFYYSRFFKMILQRISSCFEHK